jgi:Tol biopolymer transport system component
MVSDLILYRVDANAVTSSPALADPKRMETYPAWSPDGKWLYFCSAPGFDTSTVFLDENYRNIRYDLVRVGFDPETARFSGLETVLSASDLGGSVAHPRVSPDGRWLLFCRSGYGNFPLFRSAGDLVMLDLESSRVRWLDAVNSSRSEGYHTWSSNGRWFVFSSTREDGIHTRPYFSHVDPDGNASKPFVLPQEDPSRYEHELETYNIPELVSAPIPQGSRLLTESALRQDKGIKAKYSPSM